MKISIHWLKQYVDIQETPEELAELLSMLGFEAEIDLDLSGIDHCVTAHVQTCEPHPNADKLKKCTVTDGTDTFNVVCGAPNAAKGQTVVLAKVGAELPGGFVIKKAKIRGEESFGMLCSEKELGISESADGIMVLDENLPVGVEIKDILNDKISSLELDITPNRPDALNHIGIAREIALKTGRELKTPEVKTYTPAEISESVNVAIDEPKGCPRYIAGVVKNVTVKPSPKWMADALTAAGMRPINNLVDISNYILLEMGHPTHIFDYEKFPTKEVRIRNANAGEDFITLDGETHKLNADHLLITNGTTPVALAGIMGGLDSAVTDETQTVLIESAYFDPVTVRKGSKTLAMLTESSRRFERGADPQGAETAFYRIVELLEELAGGELCSEMVDAYPGKVELPTIRLRQSRLNSIAGYDHSTDFVETTLKSLGVTIEKVKEGEWDCVPPSFRPDLEREIDLIEDIIRVYGYDVVESAEKYHGIFNVDIPDPQAYLTAYFQKLVGMGFHQCYNNSLQSVEVAESMSTATVSVINPLSEQMSVLRTSLIPGLLKTADFNTKNGIKNLRLFEHGQVHHREAEGFDGLRETFVLSGLMIGVETEKSIHGETERHESMFSLKGVLSQLLGVKFSLTPNDHSSFSTGFFIEGNKETLGTAGKLSPKYIESLGLDLDEVYAFEINLDLIQPKKIVYQSISVYPSIERDINFVMDEEIKVGDIEKLISRRSKGLIKTIVPTDIFRHDSLGAGKKSIVFRITFQSDNRTLEDKEITPIIEEIISVASSKIGAKLRS